MEDKQHKGPGHGDVDLSLAAVTPDGDQYYRSWTICECSGLYQRLDTILGPPQQESVVPAEVVRATAAAVLAVPGAVRFLGTEGN
jgi:hypothetical protein